MTRTDITRLRDKASTDRAELDRLLDTTHVGHVGLAAADGHPMVVPTAVARDGDTVLLHGSTGSPWLRRVAAGVPVSVAVTAMDGLVVARSAFESSIHYRSAVLFGRCAPLTGPAKERALDALTEALLPGRIAELRRPAPAELAATLVLALPIVEWSLKVSDGWPDDPPEDVAGDAWAGVVPQHIGYGPPRPAPDLRPGAPLPASVQQLVGRGATQPAELER
jgi:nitroimidazol reductase NimA-like FMN-containing flavoprotein (pyridoxamine 5'-phosphate oxidase superfamily)